MKIVYLNTFDVNGGAARAIYRIHRGLLELGEQSSLIVRRKFSDDPTVTLFRPDSSLRAWRRRSRRQREIFADARRHLRTPVDADRSFEARLRHRLERWKVTRDARHYDGARPTGYELFSDDRTAAGPELAQSLPEADIVNLNWVAGFLDYESFFRHLPPERRLVWRLPDMNAYTGGCHYDAGCGRYTASCGDCPQLAFRGPDDLSRQIWQRKNEAYGRLADGQLHVVAISNVQAQEVSQSSLLGRFPLSVIPCGVDVESFQPEPRETARRLLGLPADKPIVLMLVDTFTRRNKGGHLLAAAMSMVHGADSLTVLTVGEGLPVMPGGVEHVHWGPVHDDRRLALLYSAADLLAFPSLQEGFGQTILEALACGLPVVGFDTGGMRDAVEHGVTGYIAEAKTCEALAASLQSALDDLDLLRGMSAACRRTAESRFSTGLVARRYRELYGTLLSGRQVARGRGEHGVE